MTALFLSQGTSKHQLRLNANIVRFCSEGCKHSAKCAVFLLWFLFFHFFFLLLVINYAEAAQDLRMGALWDL